MITWRSLRPPFLLEGILPNYTFINTDTDQEINMTMTISEMEAFKKEHPTYRQKLVPFRIGDSVRLGIRKTDNEFNDVLHHVKGSHRGSTIETR